MLLSSFLSALIDTIFPERCAHCKTIIARTHPRTALCKTCEKKIPLLSGFFCPLCYRRLYDPTMLCHKKERFVVHSSAYYATPAIRSLIYALKYNGSESAGLFLGSLISKTIIDAFSVAKRLDTPYIIAPIPLHKTRKRKRGYNQSEIIAKILYEKLYTKGMSVSYNPQLLIRTRNTPPQVDQSSDAVRAQNVRGVFEVSDMNPLKGKNILLVDDVFTSGATMCSAVKLLRAHGAREVIAVVAGRSRGAEM